MRRASAPPPEPPAAAPAAGPEDRALLLTALALAAGLVLPFALVHLDDADGVVYTVVARHLAEDGRLFDLRFLPEIFPRFREHPPFMFWVWGLAARLGSEAALPFLGAACGLATVAVAFLAARPLLGRRAAFLGAAVLATTESFFRYQARARLDPPLTLLFTSSVALLVGARGRAGLLAAGGVAAGLGVLVKGPPALGAPVAAALLLLATGRGGELRRARSWLVVAASALALPALFLVWDRLALGGDWWRGYVEDQVLASLLGRRHDSQLGSGRGTLLLNTLGRLGPWALAVAWALLRALRSPRAPGSRAALGLAAWAALVLAGYATATRTYWHYGMPAYVPLALLAGLGLDDLLARLGPRAFPRTRLAVAAAAALLLAALPLRLARHVVGPCPLGELLPAAREMAGPGGRVGLLTRKAALAEAGILAQHAGLRAFRVREPAELSARADAAVALVEAGLPRPEGFEPVARQGSWTLVRRAP